MSQIVDYMNELGLTSTERIWEYFQKTDLDTLQSLISHIQNLSLQDWSISEYSPYLFTPSMDTSGFGGCSQMRCKQRRAENFSKFASLYGDTVYLLVDSITFPHLVDPTNENIVHYRYALACDFATILTYTDLLVCGIAKIVPPHSCICRSCFEKHVINKQELGLLDPLIDEYMKKAKIIAMQYLEPSQSVDFVICELPELFQGHEGYVVLGDPKWVANFKDIQKYPVVIEDSSLVRYIIEAIVKMRYRTSKFETLVSSVYQSKFITLQSSDKAIIDTVSPPASGPVSAPVFEMPFLQNIDPSTILSLRKHEQDTFNNYRIAMDQAIKLYSAGQSPSTSKEIYDDVVYPALIKLDTMFKRAKRMRTFRAMGGLVVAASTVTLGVMNSLIPANPAGIIAALGGTEALIAQANKIIEQKLNSGNELEQNDFYFLWKLRNTKKS